MEWMDRERELLEEGSSVLREYKTLTAALTEEERVRLSAQLGHLKIEQEQLGELVRVRAIETGDRLLEKFAQDRKADEQRRTRPPLRRLRDYFREHGVPVELASLFFLITGLPLGFLAIRLAFPDFDGLGFAIFGGAPRRPSILAYPTNPRVLMLPVISVTWGFVVRLIGLKLRTARELALGFDTDDGGDAIGRIVLVVSVIGVIYLGGEGFEGHLVARVVLTFFGTIVVVIMVTIWLILLWGMPTRVGIWLAANLLSALRLDTRPRKRG
jgi:hypothetical protein